MSDCRKRLFANAANTEWTVCLTVADSSLYKIWKYKIVFTDCLRFYCLCISGTATKGKIKCSRKHRKNELPTLHDVHVAQLLMLAIFSKIKASKYENSSNN